MLQLTTKKSAQRSLANEAGFFEMALNAFVKSLLGESGCTERIRVMAVKAKPRREAAGNLANLLRLHARTGYPLRVPTSRTGYSLILLLAWPVTAILVYSYLWSVALLSSCLQAESASCCSSW